MKDLTYNSYIDVIMHQCQKYGDKDLYIFLADGEYQVERITYSELLRKIRIVVSNLARFTKVGDRVLLLCPPGIDFNLHFLSCLFAGLIPVPLYPPDTRSYSRVVSIINDCSASAAIANSSTIEKYLNRSGSNNDIIIKRFRDLHVFDSESLKQPLYEQGSQVKVDRNDVAFLQYTSGSTSNPKGVMVTHENILYNTHYISQHFQHSDNECIVSWIPPFHDMGLIKDLLTTIYSGNTLVFMSPYSFLRKPYRWLSAISQYSCIGPVSSGAPNFGYDLCVKSVGQEQLKNLDLSNWRVAYNGSEPVRPHTLDAFYNKFKGCGFRYQALEPVYGLAEATLMVGGPVLSEGPVIKYVDKSELKQNRLTTLDHAAADVQPIARCGRIIQEQETIIVDPGTFRKCMDDEVGEIWIKGRSIAKGYYKNAPETQKVFKAFLDSGEGPYLRTGDMGFIEDHYIYITGRIKDLIIINGQNHYPQDIELTACQSHEYLRENSGIAFSVHIDDVEKLVIVYEVKRSVRESVDPEEICSLIKSAIFNYHSLQVHEVVLVNTSGIPKTSSGKLQRSLCKKWYLDGNLNRIAEQKVEVE